MNIETLNIEFIKLLAKQNSSIRDIVPKLQLLPVRKFFKRVGSSNDPHPSAKQYAKETNAKLCVGYVIHKGMSEKYWKVDIHSFCLEKDKVVETTKLYDQKRNIIHYIGVVVPKEDYDSYLDLFHRHDYIKSISPVSTFYRK